MVFYPYFLFVVFFRSLSSFGKVEKWSTVFLNNVRPNGSSTKSLTSLRHHVISSRDKM